MPRPFHVTALGVLTLIPLCWSQTTPPHSPDTDVPLPKIVDRNNAVTTTTQTEMDRPISVALDGLQAWMKATGSAPRDLRLYLAGHKLTMCAPTLSNLRAEQLNFALEIHPEDRDAWVTILYEARQASDHKIPLSVGLKDNTQAFDSSVQLELQVYPHYTYLIIGLMLALLIATLLLGARTDLLRDGTTAPPAPLRLPFNLGRVQMAFWFFLVIAAYLYVWLITGEYNTVSNSVLALIGISSGTGLAAVFVDQQKVQDVHQQRTALETQKTALTARINDIASAKPEAGSTLDQELQQKKNTLTEVQAQLANSPAPPPPAISRGFIRDILSSGEGVGFHRFQMAVWTIVFGIIFVRSVYAELAMPQFDTSLLGLMGLSSGTYIGFKFPEKPK